MQTLKTAAIVVLLMTIIYSAYITLTTPPEALPPEVAKMLEMNDETEFSFDAGLPASLGTFDGTAEPGGSPLANGATSFDDGSTGMPAASPGPSFAGLPANATGHSASHDAMAVTGTLDDTSASISGGADPMAAGGANSFATSSYPTTDSTFSMPDPSGADATLPGANLPGANLPIDLGSNLGVQQNHVTQATALDAPAISTPAISTPSTAVNAGVSNAIRTADKLFNEDKLKDALVTLSLFYNTPALSGEQRSDLLARLDPLAREVIYSKRHLLEQPHRVGKNETLIEIAAQYKVPWQLLANINHVDDPVTILPGTELKVVRGPFRAEIDLVQKELTIFLDDLYAGRFPIGIGNDPPPKPGLFTVQDKQNQRTFYDAAGSPVPAGSPNNPYGNVWIDLGGQLCIHGSPSTTSPSEKGCISLAEDFASDLYGILSQGSSVTIRR